MTKNSFVAEVTFKNRPIYFHIYSTRVIRLLKQKLTFPALKSTSLFLPPSLQCLVGKIQVQKPTLVVATNQMPYQTYSRI